MIRIRQIKISVEKDNIEKLRNKICKKLNINDKDILNIRISKKSLDARQKPNLFYIYEVDIKVPNELELLNKNKFNNDILIAPKEKYIYPQKGIEKLSKRPIIVGSGPAGLTCAGDLAKKG